MEVLDRLVKDSFGSSTPARPSAMGRHDYDWPGSYEDVRRQRLRQQPACPRAPADGWKSARPATLSPFTESLVAAHFVELLGEADAQRLLLASKSVRRACPSTAEKIEATAKTIGQAVSPLCSAGMRLPGFLGPVATTCRAISGAASLPRARAATPNNHSETAMARMQGADLGGFSPAEAVLIMNAWPPRLRHEGCRLSDFFQAASARFFYRDAVEDYDFESHVFKTVRAASLWILFDYRGFKGKLCVSAALPPP